MRGFETFVGMCLAFVTSAEAQRPTVRDYGRLPLVFEPNRGQADREVKFLGRTHGGALFLTEREAVLVSRGDAKPVRMRLTHAGKPRAIQGLEPTGGISNYFIGNDPAKWRTNIPNYKRVEYKSVYAGVDLVYYGNPQKLEYDLVVAPGADVAAIQVEYEGVESVRLDGDGDLVLKTASGELRQKRPVAYQVTPSGRVEVKVGYRLKADQRVAFELARYDAGRRLLIDPVLLYSTYLGGSGPDQGTGIAVDGTSNAYVTGQTFSLNFPTTNPLQSINPGSAVFVTKINASGSAKVYSTYLGGNGSNSSGAIAVDAAGNAYVTGGTRSNSFPTASPLQASNAGGQDAFVTKINPLGSALIYSTYLGGGGDDSGGAIAVDSSGNVYVTGGTLSTNFLTANPLQANIGGFEDAFVAKINSLGSSLVYSTYLGGNGTDVGSGIAADTAGNAYVTDVTSSTNFPMSNPLQPSIGGAGFDAFVTKFNATGSAMTYSTYLGGNSLDEGTAITVDSVGNSYITGVTSSANFPTANALQPNLGSLSGSNAFITKLNSAGSAEVYSTFLGGNGVDSGSGIAVDSAGNVYITGTTDSTNFPTSNPLQATNGSLGGSNAFVTKINAVGSTLIYSTYMGGSGSGEVDNGAAIAVDSVGNSYVTGSTNSTNFPTANPLQASNGGGGDDAFVLSISSNGAQPISVSPASGSAGRQVFSYVARNTLGANSIQYTQFLYSKSGIKALNACYISYDPTANVFYLLSDDTTQWYGLLGGSGNNIGNAQCTIYGATSVSTKSGTDLTVNVDIGFRSGFAGLKNIYQFSGDTLGEGSGWQLMGTWSDTGDSNLVEIVSLTPNSGGGASQTFTAVIKEGGGANTIAFAQLVMNAGLNGYNACFIHYDRASNVFYLLNDTGTGWFGLFAGSATQVENSQCILHGVGSGGTAVGSNLTITYNLSFTGGFTGARQIYVQAVDQTGIIEVWHQTATWTP